MVIVTLLWEIKRGGAIRCWEGAEEDGGGGEHGERMHDPDRSGSGGGGAAAATAGVRIDAGSAPGGGDVGDELLLHGAPEEPLCPPALGVGLPPLQVHGGRLPALPVGRFPVQPQDPRPRRRLPLPLLPRPSPPLSPICLPFQVLLLRPCSPLFCFLPH